MRGGGGDGESGDRRRRLSLTEIRKRFGVGGIRDYAAHRLRRAWRIFDWLGFQLGLIAPNNSGEASALWPPRPNGPRSNTRGNLWLQWLANLDTAWLCEPSSPTPSAVVVSGRFDTRSTSSIVSTCLGKRSPTFGRSRSAAGLYKTPLLRVTRRRAAKKETGSHHASDGRKKASSKAGCINYGGASSLSLVRTPHPAPVPSTMGRHRGTHPGRSLRWLWP